MIYIHYPIEEKTHLIAALRNDEQQSTRVFAAPRAS